MTTTRAPPARLPRLFHTTHVSVIAGETVRREINVDERGRVSEIVYADSMDAYLAEEHYQQMFASARRSLTSIPGPSSARTLPQVAFHQRRELATDLDINYMTPPPSPPLPVLFRSREGSTVNSGDTISIQSGSTARTSGSRFSTATSVPDSTPLRTYAIPDLLDMAKSAAHANDEIQGTTKKQLNSILSALRLPMSSDRKQQAHNLFHCMMKTNETDLAALRKQHENVDDLHYGSEWELDGITPLETRVGDNPRALWMPMLTSHPQIHIILTYPPAEWPKWRDRSPTMVHLGEAGIWKLFGTKLLSFIHLHNHCHPTETRADPRPAEGVPSWPDDPLEFCKEIEEHASRMIKCRISEGSPYLMVCSGRYSHAWFEKCHKSGNGIFREGLGYEYEIVTVYMAVSQTPGRNLEIKVLRPVDRKKTATVAAVMINSPGFTAHHVDVHNDCVGKALRMVGS